MFTWRLREGESSQLKRVPKRGLEAKTLPMFLWNNFVNFMEKDPCTKFCGVLIRFHEVIKLQSFEFSVSDVYPWMYKIFHLWFCLHFLSVLWRKKPPIKFYGVFDHFSRAYEVAKFWMIKLYVNVSDVIHANDHTKYANCGLPVNFWTFLSTSFCFIIKKDNFKQNLLL